MTEQNTETKNKINEIKKAVYDLENQKREIDKKIDKYEKDIESLMFDVKEGEILEVIPKEDGRKPFKTIVRLQGRCYSEIPTCRIKADGKESMNTTYLSENRFVIKKTGEFATERYERYEIDELLKLPEDEFKNWAGS